MALELIEIKDFPKTTTLVGSGEELIVVSKADGKTYGIKTSDFKQFLGTVTSITPKPLAPIDPSPTVDGVYLPIIDGAYANAGGLKRETAEGQADYGMAVEFIKNGATWVKSSYPLPKVQGVPEINPTGSEIPTEKAVADYVKGKFTLFISPILEVGSIILGSGSPTASTTRGRTSYFINIAYASKIKVDNTSLLIQAILYYENGVFISNEAFITSIIVPNPPINATHFKLTLMHWGGTDEVTIEQLDELTLLCYSSDEITVSELKDEIDFTLPVANAYSELYIDHSLGVDLELGSINTVNGGNIGNNIRVRFVSFLDLATGSYSIENITSGFKVSRVVFYSSGSFITSTPSSSFALPPTANQIRVTFEKLINTEVITQAEVDSFVFSLSKDDENKLVSMYEDIKLLKEGPVEGDFFKGYVMESIGDSVTYGFIPRNYEGYPGILDSFAKQAAELLGMTWVNRGLSGSTIGYLNESDTTTNNPFIERYSTMNSASKVVTFMGGTNDIRKIGVLGTMEDRIGTTYYGALHILIQGLLNKYIYDEELEFGKDKLIIGITPIKIYPDSTHGGFKMIDYVNACKEVCEYYSIPCFDAYNLSGLTPSEFRTLQGTESGYTNLYNPLITDGVHPTTEGNAIFAQRLCGFIKSLVNY